MAAADTAKLVASLTLDDRGFKTGLASANKGIGSFEKTLSKVGSRASAGINQIGANLAKIGTIGAIGAVGLLAKSVQQASDLNEQLSKTAAVFGDASKEVVDFSKTTAAALGLSQAEALEAAGNFGNMFKTIGLTDDKSADFSKTLVTLASDMASFNNEDPTEMLDKIRAGLSGEAEPLKRYGVLLSEARVKTEAYESGIAKVGDALTEQQKVQARYQLILKDSTVQQGDFARTSGSLANQMRILKANLANAGATIGTALLPKITEISVRLNKLITDNQPAIIAFANKLPGAFDKALAFAEKIPWETIGKGMEQAAFFTGKLIDAFLAMPPEVQTLLIGLAGLNKLSGGAVTGIVSELGKGLIKGVLGINAGVVNVTGKTVAGGGGVGGAAGGGGKLAGFVNGAMKVFMIGAAAGIFSELLGARNEQAAANQALATGTAEKATVYIAGANVEDLKKNLAGLKERQSFLTNNLTPEAIAYQLNIDGVRDVLDGTIKGMESKLVTLGGTNAARQNVTNERLESIRMTEAAAKAQAITDSQSERSAINNVKSRISDSISETSRVAQAVRDKDLSVRVATYTTLNNKFNISQSILTQQTFKKFYTVNS